MNGVLYVAFGQEFLDQAARSAHSVKSIHPELPIAVIHNGGNVDTVFDQKISYKNPSKEFSWHQRIDCFFESPYEKTLYLDCDTYVCGYIDDIFKLLREFDFAASIDGFRKTKSQDEVPDCFPEYNGGVMAFQKSPSVLKLFDNWSNRLASEEDRLHDQSSLRYALYKTDIRIATLPSEYNCRFLDPGYLFGEAVILHGLHDDYETASSLLNSTTSPRVHVADSGSPIVYADESTWSRIKSAIKMVVRRYSTEKFYHARSFLEKG